MADVKISALPLASTPLAGTEILPIVQSATTDQVTVANLTAGRAVSASSLTLTTTPLAVGSGGTGATAFTSGSVVFAGTSGTYSEDNANFFWDDTNNRLGIGTVAPVSQLTIFAPGNSTGSNATYPGTLQINHGGISTLAATGGLEFKASVFGAGYGAKIVGLDNGSLVFGYRANSATWSESMRIDNSGNLLVGQTSGSFHQFYKNVTGATLVFGAGGGTGGVNGFVVLDSTNNGYNAANATVKVGSNGARSINAAGTINASGADYAEYMTKAGDFIIAKGDICGVDENGKLTNVYSDAVTFVVKSTSPSYVGADTWGADIDDVDELETERQKVDRIAFAGQVPVNVIGATSGDYIIPDNNNGSIRGIAISNPTFEQYKNAVGRVVATEPDGRALIIVKVA